MNENAVEPKTLPDDVDRADPTDVLIARIAADRRAGRDTSNDVEAVLNIAAQENREALDRLAT